MLTNNRLVLVRKVLFGFIFLFAFLFVFLTMDYQDGRINADVGYKLARGLLSGTFKEAFNSMWLSYGVTIYFIYAIWNVPVAFVDILKNQMTDFNVCVGPFLWNKLLLVLFLAGCCYWIYRIVEIISPKAAVLIMALFVTSPITFFPVVAITQCDVMTLFFGLAGIYFLMKKKDIPFLIFFAIASTMKYLILFIFVPLLLFKYKKVKYWVIGGGAGGGLILLSRAISNLSERAQAVTSDPGNYVQWHLDQFLCKSVVPLGIGNVSILVVYFLIICLIAYLTEAETYRMYVQWIFWICLAGWYTLFIFYGANSYWYVLMSPFLILILFNNAKYWKFGIFLELVLSNIFLLERVPAQPWVFGGQLTFSRLLLGKKVTENPDLLFNAINMFLRGNYEQLVPILISLIVVGAFALLILFVPPKKKCIYKINSRMLIIACWVNLFSIVAWIAIMLNEQMKYF